jgi:Uri superfamily endonuclease
LTNGTPSTREARALLACTSGVKPSAFRAAVGLPTLFGMRSNLAAIEPEPGTYALVLSARANGLVRVGRLGLLPLQPGFYVYVGSALGSGGVRARLAHHLKTSQRPHWHIDYLRRHTSLAEVWYCYDRASWEHAWAQCLGTLPGASVPLAGFGSSDCQCESHLYFFQSRPSRNAFVRSLRASCQRHPPVRLRKD